MTAVSDETGRDWLPLKYEDGPDFCTVTFATGAAFALTVHPERMKLMEAALSAATAGDCSRCDQPDRVNELAASAAVAQEPVAGVEFTEAGLIRFWTSDPARAEAERTRRSLTKFTLSELIALVGRPRTPPATPAGVGADEIAQIIATKCFDPRVIDSSGKPFWKKSQWREAQQAANAILLLLSGGRSEQERSQQDGSR